MNTIIGIDVSQKSSSFHLLAAGGKGTDGSFSMNHSGFAALLQKTEGLENPRFVMESTGRYHITLANWLLHHGQSAFIVNPVLVKQFSRAHTLRRTKTDTVDARVIAQFAAQDTKALAHPGREMDDERLSVARRREQIAEDIARAKTQLKADLTVAFPEILELNVFTAGMLDLLVHLPSAQAVWQASDTELAGFFTGTRGRSLTFGPERVRGLAVDSIGVASYGPLVSDSAKNLLSLLARQKLLTQRLIDLVSRTQADDLAIITSIDGIGQVTAAHFLAEIGSIGRFERYQNLIAFCGTDPGIYQSGNSLVSGRITKHGNASLRKYVYLMAEGTLLHNPFFRAYYDKKRAEGFAHRKAMVALMNKLLKTLFALLTKREMFMVPEHSISHSL